MFEKSFRVVDDKGFVGTLRAPARFLDDRTEKAIELENGQKLTVRADQLKVQQDGSFFLQRNGGNSRENIPSEVVLPISTQEPASDVQESSVVDPVAPEAPAPVRSGAQTKIAESPTRVEPLPGSFYSDDYEIERIPIDKIVDHQVESRQEGDTLILPVLEEVLVFQKKMLLKEEVRITRRRKPVEQIRRFDDSVHD